MKLTVKVKVAWWLRPYLSVLSFFCLLTGAEPNWAKLSRVVDRAVKLRVKK